jgi:hypothetical protein
MLVKITDHKGRAHFVNPLYIKSVFEKKPGHVEVHGSFTSLAGKLVVKDESGEELCDRISIALTTIGAAGAAAVSEEFDGSAAGVAAASSGASAAALSG